MVDQDSFQPQLSKKLWIYTNYDCNLNCVYCVAESHPRAIRRALSCNIIDRVVAEAIPLDFQEIYLTGGEPFILQDIFETIAVCASQLKTTVLTNATLLRGKRLERLADLATDPKIGGNLMIQVSLDGARPAHHDPCRGQGTWKKTVVGIQSLQDRGLKVHLSSTITEANQAHLEELSLFREQLGIPAEWHIIRPLARRGFSQTGLEIDPASIEPELTVSKEGVFWHPLASPEACDMLVCKEIFPLSRAVECLKNQLQALTENPLRKKFT